MEDDSSNDVIAMERAEPALPARIEHLLADKPIMQFFRRLITNNSSQNTILTNLQIEDMLTREFNFNLSSLHALEVEIYVGVLKKYLKDWPSWDEFDHTIKKKLNDEDLAKTLETKYESLKIFLKTNLDMAQELSAELVTKLKEAEKKQCGDTPNSNNVVLEIKATRNQLNKLIYRTPHPDFNNTIFNVSDNSAPKQIRLNTSSLEAILNWWSVKITISIQMNFIFLSRETTHKLEHTLVNRNGARNNSTPPVTLDDQLQIKELKKARKVPTKQILGCLDLLSSKHDAEMEGMETIIDVLRKDLNDLECCITPAYYRRYLFKHRYVRYLYSDVESNSKPDKDKYDIQLMEQISPMHQFFIGRIDGVLDKSLPAQWLKVECMSCNATFTGQSLASDLKEHFDEYHQLEPDWICTNCCKSFSMAQLAENWWSHDCQIDVRL